MSTWSSVASQALSPPARHGSPPGRGERYPVCSLRRPILRRSRRQESPGGCAQGLRSNRSLIWRSSSGGSGRRRSRAQPGDGWEAREQGFRGSSPAVRDAGRGAEGVHAAVLRLVTVACSSVAQLRVIIRFDTFVATIFPSTPTVTHAGACVLADAASVLAAKAGATARPTARLGRPAARQAASVFAFITAIADVRATARLGISSARPAAAAAAPGPSASDSCARARGSRLADWRIEDYDGTRGHAPTVDLVSRRAFLKH
jgi:hypothetical protein